MINIKKESITKSSRKVTGYTLDCSADMVHWHDPEVEKDLTDKIAKEIEKEINKDVLLNLQFQIVVDEIKENPSLAILHRDSNNKYIKAYVSNILKKEN